MRFQNELVLIISLVVINSTVVGIYALLKKEGLYAWNVICTIASNIEVLILIRAFGMETTLGNVLFASSFLVTDILSENYSKEQANKCVLIGLISSVLFIAISQSWFLFIPSENDVMSSSIRTVFSNTPRIMMASLLTYAVCQLYDVWSYHFIWGITSKKTGDKTKYLWLRNNVSTLVSQLINVVMFNLLAFAGVYPKQTLAQIITFGYLFFIATSLLDTPFIYLARRIR